MAPVDLKLGVGMPKIAGSVIAAWLLWLAGSAAPTAHAAQAFDESVCRNEEALLAADLATQGGCLTIHRRKGNCNACHLIGGVPSGDIAPPLAFVAQRFPDKSVLRAQIEDARRFNPSTVMPPFGAHHILTPEEIDKVVEFLRGL
jgi:L-cysteine S-thiosulfotransferase